MIITASDISQKNISACLMLTVSPIRYGTADKAELNFLPIQLATYPAIIPPRNPPTVNNPFSKINIKTKEQQALDII